jgi:HEPN domain-containing protein
MIRFYAGLVTTVMRDLAFEVSALGWWVADIEHHGGERTIASLSYDVRAGMIKALNQLVENPDEMPLSRRIRFKIERLKNRVENEDDPITASQAMALLQELHNDITAELATPYFLMIPEEKRPLYEQPHSLFGEKVALAFTDASFDIAAAGRLFALDEWTACVFHLMRAVELALRLLARRLGIKKVDTKQWATLLDDLDKAIAAIRQQGRTPARDRKLQYYSDARAQFGVFKDAWRNHVMHSREKYDEREAIAIYGGVRAFMDILARGVPR